MDDWIPSVKESPGGVEASDTPFIAYWVWHGDKFVPATAEQAEKISEHERVRAALWRLRTWERLEHPEAIQKLLDRVHILLAGLAKRPTSYLNVLCRRLHKAVPRPGEAPKAAASRCNVSHIHGVAQSEQGNDRAGGPQ